MTRQGRLRALPLNSEREQNPTNWLSAQDRKTYKALPSTLAPTPSRAPGGPAPRPQERGEAPVINMQLLRRRPATPQGEAARTPGHSLTCTWAAYSPGPPCGAATGRTASLGTATGSWAGTRQPVRRWGRCGHWPQALSEARARTTLTVSTESPALQSSRWGPGLGVMGGVARPRWEAGSSFPTARPQHSHPFPRRAHEQGSGNISHQRPGDPAWPLAVRAVPAVLQAGGSLRSHREPPMTRAVSQESCSLVTACVAQAGGATGRASAPGNEELGAHSGGLRPSDDGGGSGRPQLLVVNSRVPVTLKATD